ncbi:vWA domain-containing protein [Rossellomorea vietnamensis]|uniref:vWA domain-containing protein n=1 Tax=Rossellomorea TaxID=2837508 RepID=UPI00165370D9|nr:VWA domain-containing protein [Rossellomorea aquimaris]
MKKRFSAAVIFTIIFSFMIQTSLANASGQPLIEFSVQPSANEYVKPQNGDAQGRLDIELTPSGQATNEERKPIDVVFVHDTSGSMADTYGGAKKATSAENALKESLKFFEQNKQSNDKYYFVPFDSDVSYKNVNGRVVNPETGLGSISEIAENLDYGYYDWVQRLYHSNRRGYYYDWVQEYQEISNGGTNYTQSLEYALQKFSAMRDSKRYIIFLTDGEPTSLKYQGEDYTLYTNGTAKVGNRNYTYDSVQNFIQHHAVLSAEKLGRNDVTMFSIAFAQPGEVNYQLLETMSNKTGGRAIQANPNSLSNVFTDISKEFNSPSIEGEVQIDLSKFNGKVKLAPNSDAYMDDRNVLHMKYNFTYPIGKSPSPANIQLSLPLEFTQQGQYVFDNIKLIQKDFDGKTLPAVTHENVTINIVDEAAPKFESAVKINGNQYHAPENLVKMGMQNNEHNEFSIEYDITPSAMLQANKSGNLKNIKIIQPLPDGISLKSSALQTSLSGSLSGATVRETTQNGQRVLEIKPGKTITYNGNQFSQARLNMKAILQADFAMSLVKMPKAAIHYTDSNFSSQNHTLTSHSGYIGLQVILNGMADNTTYIGDHTGKLTKKEDATNEVKAEATPKPLPVKGLELKDGNTIRVHYNDNSFHDIFLKTDFAVYETNTEKILSNNEETTGPASFKVSKKVGGEDVVYYYKTISGQKDSGWKKFQPDEPVALPADLIGNIEIQVKTEGGFTLNEQPVSKNIVIVKKVNEINVTPNPIEVTAGESISFQIEVLPLDATDKSVTVQLLNSNGKISSYSEEGSGNHRILGTEPGDDQLVIEANDGSGVRIIVPVKVIDPYVALEEVKFKQAKINLPLNDQDIPIEAFLIFNPSNATNKELAETVSSAPAIEAVEKDGKWYIRTEELGFTTVTVTADEDNSLTDSAVFEVVTPEEGGDDNPYIDGRW